MNSAPLTNMCCDDLGFDNFMFDTNNDNRARLHPIVYNGCLATQYKTENVL